MEQEQTHSGKKYGYNLCHNCQSKNIEYIPPMEWVLDSRYNTRCKDCKHLFNRI